MICRNFFHHDNLKNSRIMVILIFSFLKTLKFAAICSFLKHDATLATIRFQFFNFFLQFSKPMPGLKLESAGGNRINLPRPCFWDQFGTRAKFSPKKSLLFSLLLSFSLLFSITFSLSLPSLLSLWNYRNVGVSLAKITQGVCFFLVDAYFLFNANYTGWSKSENRTSLLYSEKRLLWQSLKHSLFKVLPWCQGEINKQSGSEG